MWRRFCDSRIAGFLLAAALVLVLLFTLRSAAAQAGESEVVVIPHGATVELGCTHAAGCVAMTRETLAELVRLVKQSCRGSI